MRLLRQVLELVAANRGPLLGILVPLYLVGAVAFLAIADLVESSMRPLSVGRLTGGAVVGTIVKMGGLLLVSLIGQIVLAVIWHRMVLVPGDVVPRAGHILRYLWASTVLAILLVVAVYVPVTLSGDTLLSLAGNSDAGYLVFQAVMFAVYVFGAWLWLRAGLILPDAALGHRRLGVAGSFAATRAWGVGVLAVACVQVLLMIGADRGVGYLGAGSGPATVATGLLLWPLGPFLGLAALTVMYRDAAAKGEGRQ